MSTTGAGRGPTIADIAAKAGVSTGAVSYALNGRPGVSDATRARILAVADEIGWVPNSAARALSGSGSSTVGLVVTRAPEVLGIEPFFMNFIAGIERGLDRLGYALLLSVTPEASKEIPTYRSWWRARRVDGVFVTDVHDQDTRVQELQELGIPAVVVGDPALAGSLPAVWSDDAHTAEAAVTRLAELGHRRIGHIAGPERFIHTRRRHEAIAQTCARLGMEFAGSRYTDYTWDNGAQATRDFLADGARPDALIYDNDLTALAGVRAVADAGLSVPTDVSILAWDDSPLCRLTNPPLSAVSRDVSSYGELAAETLLTLIAEGSAASVRAEDAVVVDRGSLLAR